MQSVLNFCGLTTLLFFLTLSLAGKNQRKDKPLEEQDERPAGRSSLRVSVEQIRVDVSVRTKKGHLVQGLKKGNFKIYEEKIEQKIENFSATEAPMTAVLVTEYSNAIPWNWLYQATIASSVFVQNMRKGDWVAAVIYDLNPQILVDFTQNKMEIYNAFRRLHYPGFSESNMYDTIHDVLDRVEELEGKVAIILITSGIDTLSRKNLDTTLKKVKNSNVVIFPISLGGYTRARYEHRMSEITRLTLIQADAALKAFAKYTGGEAFFPRFVQGYGEIFRTISLLLRNQYSLSYVSTNKKKNGKFRKIKVRVKADPDGDGKPDKLKIRHRAGYQAAKS